MKKMFLGVLFTLFSTLLFAGNFNEGDNLSLNLTDSISSATWEIHHPGLVRWIENGMKSESYQIPGCFLFFFDSSITEITKKMQENLTKLMKTIEAVSPSGKKLSLEKVNGTWMFVDRDVQALYVGEYTLKSKSGKSFKDLSNEIIPEISNGQVSLDVSFDRGCAISQRPRFFKK